MRNFEIAQVANIAPRGGVGKLEALCVEPFAERVVLAEVVVLVKNLVELGRNDVAVLPILHFLRMDDFGGPPCLGGALLPVNAGLRLLAFQPLGHSHRTILLPGNRC
jgi:hypothetical protein